MAPIKYMSGFGNSFETEALPGALPVGRNSPQKVNYGLYAEQISGSPFTAPQATNERTWLYRIRPTVRHTGRFQKIDKGAIRTAPERDDTDLPIGQLRWSPTPLPKRKLTFVTGMHTMTTAGDAEAQTGMAAHVLLITKSMEREHFFNADGEMLIVAQQNKLRFRTEFGVIEIEPGEICVIPRGVDLPRRTDQRPGARLCAARITAARSRCRIAVRSAPTASPTRAISTRRSRPSRTARSRCTLIVKWGGELYRTKVPHSPLDVVAWHGNYYPYKYDLRRFSPVGALLYDHPDPSIYTVMTAPSETPGTANIDFVIFPERWAVAENTFRPPWYHRNIMSEFMGLVYGVYDAKPEGFVPGGMSLHNQMLPHGPDADAFEHASNVRAQAGQADQHAAPSCSSARNCRQALADRIALMPGHQLHPRPFVPDSKRPRVVVWAAPGPSVPVRALRVGWDRRQVGYQLRAGYTLFFHYAPLTLRRRCWVPPKAHMSTSGSGRRGAGQRTAHRWRRKRASKCGWPAPQPTLTLLSSCCGAQRKSQMRRTRIRQGY